MALRYLIPVLVLCACAAEKTTQSGNLEGLPRGDFNHLYVAVASPDFKTGGMQKIDLVQRTVSQPFPAHSDAQVRWDASQGKVLLLNRMAGNHLSIVAPDLRTFAQIGLPEGSNPQDVLALGDGTAYVTGLHSTRLLRVDTQGGTVGEGVDLSTWKDGDGFPEAVYLAKAGDRVLVTLQRLNAKTYRPWPADGAGNVVESKILVVDPRTDAVESVRSSLRQNPFSDFKTFDGDIYLGDAGVVDRRKPVTDGAIERIRGKGFDSLGAVIEEAVLLGDIFDFEILDSTNGVAIVGRPDTTIVFFDPSSGTKREKEIAGTAFQYPQVLVDRERALFFLLDRNEERPAIRVFDFNGEEKVAKMIDLTLPPMRAVLAP